MAGSIAGPGEWTGPSAIGQFAPAVPVSLNQLRHYDEVGLLPPARVDPYTGYRYYRPDQVPGGAVDRPVALAGRAAAGDRRGAGERRRRAGRRPREHGGRPDPAPARARDALPRADRRSAAGRRAPRRGAGPGGGDGERYRPLARVSPITSGCAQRLDGALEAARVPPIGPLVGRFPLELGDELTVMMAAEVAPDAEVPGTEPGTLSGGTFAVATHTGPYDQITLTTHAVLAWVGPARPRGGGRTARGLRCPTPGRRRPTGW